MAYTLEQVETLEAAIATGTTRVEYEDKVVEYDSLKDMLARLRIMKIELGLATKGGGRRLASFSKGLT